MMVTTVREPPTQDRELDAIIIPQPSKEERQPRLEPGIIVTRPRCESMPDPKRTSSNKGVRGPKAETWVTMSKVKPKDPGKAKCQADTPRSRSSSMSDQGPIGRKPGTRRMRGSTLTHQKDLMMRWVTRQGGGEGEKRRETEGEGEKRKRPEHPCSESEG